jgi:O-antigen ligase
MLRRLNHDSSGVLWTEEERKELPGLRPTMPIGTLCAVVAVVALYLGATVTDTLPVLGALTILALFAGLAYAYPGAMLIAVVVTSILIPIDLAVKADIWPRLGPTRGMVAAFLLGAFLNRKTRAEIFKSMRQSTLTVPIILFFVATVVSMIFSIDPLKSAYSLISLIFEEFLFFFAFIYFTTQERFRVNLKNALFLTTMLVCLFAFYEELSHYNPILLVYPEEEILFRGNILRVRSTFFHPIAFACFLSFMFPLFLVEFIQADKGTGKYIIGLLLLCVLAASFLTVSRGPWISLLVTSFIFICWWSRKSLNRMVLASVGIGLAIVSIVFFTSASSGINKSAVGKVINPSGITTRSVDEASPEYYRIALTYAVIEHLKGARWIYGFGPGTFHLAHVESAYAGHEHVLTAADSDYIRLLFEFGVIGVITFLSLLGNILLLCVRAVRKTKGKDKPLALASFGAILGFIFTNVSVSMFGYLPLRLLFWLCVAFIINLRKMSVINRSTK